MAITKKAREAEGKDSDPNVSICPTINCVINAVIKNGRISVQLPKLTKSVKN